MFAKAYGSEEIDIDRAAKAIASLSELCFPAMRPTIATEWRQTAMTPGQ
jgi:hypothetical protein